VKKMRDPNCSDGQLWCSKSLRQLHSAVPEIALLADSPHCVPSPACGTLGVCFAALRDHAFAAGFAIHTFSAMKFRVDFRQHVVSCGSVCSEPRESQPICLAEFSTPALLLNLQVLILKFCGCTF